MNRNKGASFIWVVVALVVLIGLALWWKPKADERKVERQKEMTSREVALLCTTDMATEFHIHPELTIVIDGEPAEVPANIGVTASCMNSLHTHDSTGTFHVESPVQKDFTLGDFFAVWKKDFSKDRILDAALNDTMEVVVMVNGERVDTYENTILRDKDKIVISYQKR